MQRDSGGVRRSCVEVLVRLGAVADVHLTLEDDINRVVGHRLRAMGVLALRGPF